LLAVYQPILHTVPKERKPQDETEFGQIKGSKMESRKYCYSLRLIIDPCVLQQQTYLVSNQQANKRTNRKNNSLDQCLLETLITSQALQKLSACKERAR
jgi:hypothetical protein